MSPLRIALLAATAGSDLRANRVAVRDAIEQAAAARARLLVTPECMLCGYPVATGALGGTDCALAEAADELMQLAQRRGLGLILGSTVPDGRGGFLDAAQCGGAIPTQTFGKRVLTPADRAWFAPAQRTAPQLVRIDGWQLAVGICYEIRQARWWYDAARSGADAGVILAHQAGRDPDPGTKATVLPALHAARAAELAMPIALANTAAPDRWLDTAAWDARGMIIAQRAEGLLVAELVHHAHTDPWYAGVRRDALGVG
jgi:predicted amidohydrolase